MRQWLKRILSAVIFYSGLIALLRYAGRDHVKVLLYHSVSNGRSAPGAESWSVDPTTFERHLSYIAGHYRVIPLKALVEALQKGEVPAGSVVVTFDDGFMDTYEQAYPALKRQGVPATVFLVTGAVDDGKPIWIQEIHRLMESFGAVRVVRELRVLVGDNGAALPDVAKEKQLRRQVEDYLGYGVTKGRRDELLAGLFSVLGATRDSPADRSLFLTWRQIEEMHATGIIGFGSHGVTHTPFSVMSPQEQEAELAGSRQVLERHLGEGFIPFSYPFGQAHDFTPETRQLVQAAEYPCALTAMPTLNKAGTSVHELGRMPVHNVPVHLLALELEKGTLKSAFRLSGGITQEKADSLSGRHE